MAKILDNIMIRIIVFSILFIWTYFITRNIWWTILITLFVYILIWLIVKIVRNKKGNIYSSDKLETHFAIMGNDYVINLIEKSLNTTDFTIKYDNSIILNNEKGNEMIISRYKFSDLGYEDIASIYRLACNEKVKKVYVLSKGVDRSAIMLSDGLNIKFVFVKTDTIYRYLKNSDTLPDLVEFDAKPMSKVNIALMFQGLLSPSNTKYFVFSGVILALMSIATPLSGYYAVFATISLVLAIITMLPFAKNIGKEKEKLDVDSQANNATYKSANDSSFVGKLKKIEKKAKAEESANTNEKNDKKNKDTKEVSVDNTDVKVEKAKHDDEVVTKVTKKTNDKEDINSHETKNNDINKNNNDKTNANKSANTNENTQKHEENHEPKSKTEENKNKPHDDKSKK